MLSRHLLIGFVIEIVIVGGLLWWGFQLSALVALGSAVSIMVAVRLLVAILSFVVGWLFRSERSADMTIGTAHTTKMIARELVATIRLFFVLHPLEPWLNSRDPKQSSPRDIPVVLVHGFFSNGGFWWSLQRFLRGCGINSVYTINLEPLFGDMGDYAKQLAERVESICRDTGDDKVLLIGHSMGGLVCRHYAETTAGQQRIAKIVTLGAPHDGTVEAWLLPGKNLRQMRPKNDWLSRLNDARHATVPITSIYSCHDNIVVPQASSDLRGAKNISVPGVGHLEMAFSPEIHRLILEEIVGFLTP